MRSGKRISGNHIPMWRYLSHCRSQRRISSVSHRYGIVSSYRRYESMVQGFLQETAVLPGRKADV